MTDTGTPTPTPDADKTPEPDKPKTGSPDDGGKTLTQADVDRIVTERVARERGKYADYPELQKAAKRLQEIEAANATELEKAVAKARDEGRAEVQTTANARLVAAEARALAAEAKFRNPGLAIKAIDTSQVRVADDGTVDAGAIKDLLTELAKADPYLVDDGKLPRPKPDDAQGRPPATPASTATPGMGRLREAYAETALAKKTT